MTACWYSATKLVKASTRESDMISVIGVISSIASVGVVLHEK
jgi:hypothetical protein